MGGTGGGRYHHWRSGAAFRCAPSRIGTIRYQVLWNDVRCKLQESVQIVAAMRERGAAGDLRLRSLPQTKMVRRQNAGESTLLDHVHRGGGVLARGFYSIPG